eukprot:CAMPEP_0204225828 /NCGR_PEP_ID=MMETSP0361-20130328/84489_1 /ASSEMBLY_ACC=CAM_ASM_000343 /TAXON_ID=268821 /ORGANISM="Scrippsiella Hangoei, Strain SHTV-5" /LENGTH=62 /DNA_ID=CAMNT_0051192485 /DNA_START=45 /DNA_END=230 /DNA_ORIENTATION=+
MAPLRMQALPSRPQRRARSSALPYMLILQAAIGDSDDRGERGPMATTKSPTLRFDLSWAALQ